MTAPAASILVVDDEPDLRALYELTLLREGYRVETASTLQEAREQLGDHKFDAVITDMRLPDGFGMELLQDLRVQQRRERCVVMTAYGSAENAVEALRSGAFDYLTKPVDLKQFRSVVASAVQGTGGVPAPRALRNSSNHSRNGAATDVDAPNTAHALNRLVGESEAMHNVKQRVLKVSRGMAPVLIRGESGTGKELVAQALHACSQRADGPLVAVNCGAIPENLLEAEFFGARKGSYTGAAQDRDGYFQAARGGTLFLDEIGDLPLAMQSKLLRAIQERSVRPLGSTQEETVDVRIVSATHRDLAADVQSGRFRQDLYYRLNVIEIVIPPLRERREDLPALCSALLNRISQDSGMPVPALTARALEAISAHPLTGNVRELENLLHRAVALSDGEELQVDWPTGSPEGVALRSAPAPTSVGAAEADVPGSAGSISAVSTSGPAPLLPTTGSAALLPNDLQAWLDQQERDILVRALREANFNRTATAARLGISLRQIRYRIERLNIALPGDPDPNEDIVG
ncbi:sigma-54-dependent transcriptional regulator [Acidovorax sp.]|jgi:two-component system response regulator PilR (NtrC family)|uniref:sigma-54-dependent transcriptional regulator n=1 Tax=Acidovorax sp. TaxID=1872122 RepID=UPI00391F8EEC